jgi:VCBS repeat-containing protein
MVRIPTSKATRSSVTAVEGEAGFVGSELVFTGSGALLTLNSDGSYVYDPNGKFEYLGAGESAIETFSYTVSDGNGGSDTATVSITVNGANDAAVVGGQDTGTTAPGAQEGELNAQGVLTVADPDQNQSLFAAGTVGGSYGNLVIDEAGNWTYTALANHPAIAPLTDGETLIDVVTVTTYDGTTHDVSITISGSNEAPVAFDNTRTIAENEATAQAGNVILDDDGLGLDSDADGNPLSVTNVAGNAVSGTGNTVVTGLYGTLTIAASGVYSYVVNTADPFVIGLSAGETLTDSFSYTITDGAETGKPAPTTSMAATTPTRFLQAMTTTSPGVKAVATRWTAVSAMTNCTAVTASTGCTVRSATTFCTAMQMAMLCSARKAMTRSMAALAATRSMAAQAATCCMAKKVWTGCSAAPTTTRFMAALIPTPCSVKMASTRSTAAMVATRLTAEKAATACSVKPV